MDKLPVSDRVDRIQRAGALRGISPAKAIGWSAPLRGFGVRWRPEGAGFLLAAVLLGGALTLNSATALADTSAWSQNLEPNELALHLCNRLAFGPRPGDLERVRSGGLTVWVEEQMRPTRLASQPSELDLERRLGALSSLQMEPRLLSLAFAADAANIRRVLEARASQRGEAAPRARGAGGPSTTLDQLSERQRATVLAAEAAGIAPGTSMQALGELSSDKIARAVESNRQLQEVLVDFWSNHFNVDAAKGPVRVLKIGDDREVIRPHVFGSFRAMLGASAKSPAMLLYLDNARSSAQVTMRDGATRGGINENYARELMELHTLGVEGGYTQADVTEVARVFTGWGLDYGANGAAFRFMPMRHDRGPKTVLGHSFPGGQGQAEGERVLDLLANHPSTAKFLARKLCQRFVSDDPPPVLVDRVARAFTASNGDLPAVYRALFLSPEFASRAAFRAKVKSPFETAVSSARALDARMQIPDARLPRDRARLVQIGAASGGRVPRGAGQKLMALEIATMGQPIFNASAPTGYPEDSARWVSSSALVARLNFAIALSNGRITDVLLGRDTFAPTPLETLSLQLLGTRLSPATRQVIESSLEESDRQGPAARALLLGSPEFQRR